jgi:mRNA-degrading endonuclease toxin of MazEF toxin-antitoxin module
VNVSQVVTLDKATLETRLGTLDSMHMQEVDAGLRLALSL